MYWRPRSPASTLESSRRNGVVSSPRILECRKTRPPVLVGPDRGDVLGTRHSQLLEATSGWSWRRLCASLLRDVSEDGEVAAMQSLTFG